MAGLGGPIASVTSDQIGAIRDDRSTSIIVVIVELVVVVRIGMERVIGAEEQVAQAQRRVLAAHGRALAAGQVLEVGRLFAQHAEQRLAPGGVAAERMARVLGHPLDREPQQVDPVARREVELELVRLLEELDRQGQQCVLGERQVVLEDRHLVVARRETRATGSAGAARGCSRGPRRSTRPRSSSRRPENRDGRGS